MDTSENNKVYGHLYFPVRLQNLDYQSVKKKKEWYQQNVDIVMSLELQETIDFKKLVVSVTF